MNKHIHRSTRRVIYGDTDAAAIVYHANFLRYFEIGRTELMREWVCTYSDIEKQGIILPITECYTRFKAPAFYDDLIIIETYIAKLTELTCRFNYKIFREEEGQEKLLAKGYTVHAAVNKSGKLTKLPTDITNKISKFVALPTENNKTTQNSR